MKTKFKMVAKAVKQHYSHLYYIFAKNAAWNLTV